MKDNRFLVISVIAVVVLILIAIGVTYAYFQNQVTNTGNVNVGANVSNATEVDYNTKEDISLLKAEPGAKDEIEFNIVLTASNKTNDTINYGIDWIIDTNTFVYEPEHPGEAQLVYSLYYSDDNSTWNTFTENQDCTESKGTVTLASNQTLTAAVNTTKKIYWKFVVEYKALNYNQATNMEKTLSGKIIVTGLE